MRRGQSEIKERVNRQSNRRDLGRTKTRMPSAPPFQFSAFSSSNFCARLIYIEKIAPEESLYVVFSRKAGEKPGFWHEESWGSCDCMSMRRIWGKELTVRVERTYSIVQHRIQHRTQYPIQNSYMRSTCHGETLYWGQRYETCNGTFTFPSTRHRIIDYPVEDHITAGKLVAALK
jgi:hypothetical protein